jgi:hypothetical protein
MLSKLIILGKKILCGDLTYILRWIKWSFKCLIHQYVGLIEEFLLGHFGFKSCELQSTMHPEGIHHFSE